MKHIAPKVIQKLQKRNISLGKAKLRYFFYLILLLFNFQTSAETVDFVEIKILDKVSSQTSQLKLNILEETKFENLIIKALKCKSFEGANSSDTVAYIQVKDLSNRDNDRVFLFNGWTFASSPTLQSIDHPIYDLWITGCENI